MQIFDLIVIGGGSGGVRAARMAAQQGAKVAIIEESYWGGTCVNVGCIPKKLFVYASEFPSLFNIANAYGWQSTTPSFNWPVLLQHKNKEISRLNGLYKKLLTDLDIHLVWGHASFIDAHTLSVNNSCFKADKILIATGSTPVIPNIPGKEYGITSDQAFYLEKLPQRALVVGGGYIALEFANIFQGLACETTLVIRRDLPLRGFDETIRKKVKQNLIQQGIHVLSEHNVVAIEKENQAYKVHFQDNKTQMVDCILFATGRIPNSHALNLDKIGVKVNHKGAIVVDEYYQTAVESIYALGDVIDHYPLTPVAIAQAMAFVKTHFQHQPQKVNYDFVATVVFSQPNVGTVGLTEAQAREQYQDIDIYQAEFRSLKYALTDKTEKIFMKMIVDKASDRVLGLHMVGDEAGEIIQGFAAALQAGATKAVFDQTIAIHPTIAEEWVTMRQPVVIKSQ